MTFWIPSSIAILLALCSHGASGEGEDLMVELADEVLANKQRSLPIPWEIVKYTPTYRDVGYMGEHAIGKAGEIKVQLGSLQTFRDQQGLAPNVMIGRALGKEDNLPADVRSDFRYTGVGGGDEIRHLNGMKNPDAATTMWGWHRQKWSTVMAWMDFWISDRGNPRKLAVIHTSGNVLYGGCDESTLIYKYNQIIAANGVTGSAKVVVGAELSPYPEDLGWSYERSPNSWTGTRMTDTLSAMGVPVGWVSKYADCTNRTLGPCTSPPKYQFANAGVIMGEVGAISGLIADLGSYDLENRGITDYYLKNPDKVAVDYSGSLSMSLHNMKADNLPVEVATRGGKKILKNKQTDQAVCFVVGNGNSFPALKTLAAGLKA